MILFFIFVGILHFTICTHFFLVARFIKVLFKKIYSRHPTFIIDNVFLLCTQYMTKCFSLFYLLLCHKLIMYSFLNYFKQIPLIIIKNVYKQNLVTLVQWRAQRDVRSYILPIGLKIQL